MLEPFLTITIGFFLIRWYCRQHFRGAPSVPEHRRNTVYNRVQARARKKRAVEQRKRDIEEQIAVIIPTIDNGR